MSLPQTALSWVRRLPTVPRRALAHVTAARRIGFYAAAGSALGTLALPSEAVDRRNLRDGLRRAYDLHARELARPEVRSALRRAELEDLFLFPLYLAVTPLDIARVLDKRRRRIQKIRPVPRDQFPYPSYYLNDFHHQANGNLSLSSAIAYEWQIRFLFLGANRLMRQGVVDAIPAGDNLDILDVGCGTSAWMTMARLQGRKHRLTGIDLSPDYLRVARLFRGRHADFLQMNAEVLSPEWTARFDVVTTIWLFHELPPSARERVVAEMARVLKPGGQLVFLDAIQLCDDPSPGLEAAARRFHRFFNEPYFLDYQHTDLPALFARHGLEVQKTERWFASKLVTARKA